MLPPQWVLAARDSSIVVADRLHKARGVDFSRRSQLLQAVRTGEHGVVLAMVQELFPAELRQPGRRAAEDVLVEDDDVAQVRQAKYGAGAGTHQRFVLANESLAGIVDPDFPGQPLLGDCRETRKELGGELRRGKDGAGTGAMEVLAPKPAAHGDRQFQAVTQGMRPGTGRIGRIARQQFEHVGVHGVAAAGEEHVAAAEGPFLIAVLGPNAFHRARIGHQQPGHAGFRANGDIALRHFAVKLLEHHLEDRLAGRLAPEIARHAVTGTSRRRARYRMTGKRNEALVEYPVQRVRRVVHRAPDNVRVRLAVGNLHDVVVMAIRRIYDALVLLQPCAGRADLSGGHGERAAQRVRRFQHQYFRVAPRRVDGGRQAGCAGAHDDEVPPRLQQCPGPHRRDHHGQGGACPREQFSSFHRRGVYMRPAVTVFPAASAPARRAVPGCIRAGERS